MRFAKVKLGKKGFFNIEIRIVKPEKTMVFGYFLLDERNIFDVFD